MTGKDDSGPDTLLSAPRGDCHAGTGDELALEDEGEETGAEAEAPIFGKQMRMTSVACWWALGRCFMR